METTKPSELLVSVDFTGRDGWEVDFDDTLIMCDSLEDARRIAIITARRRSPCELVVRDAYHRVLEHSTVDADGSFAPSGR